MARTKMNQRSANRVAVPMGATGGRTPLSKVTVMLSDPVEEDEELKYDRRSTPESCSSIGAATVFASVSALAPG